MVKKLIVLFGIISLFAFIAAEKAKIKGSLSVSERPIRDIDVTLKKMPAGEVVQVQKTDQRGSFFFENIEAGNYQLEFKNLEVTSPLDVIKGRITKEKTFRSNLEVLLLNDFGQLIATTTTDPRGEFSFRSIEAGTYTVQINVGQLSEIEQAQ